MRKLTKLEKFGLVAAVIVAGTYFYIGKVYDPEAKALKKTVIKLNKVVKEHSSLKDISSIKSINNTIKKREKKLEEIVYVLENTAKKRDGEAEITELLSRINSLAEQNRLAMTSIIPKGGIKGVLFAWSGFDLDMKGSFFSFVNFLSGLEKMSEPLRVKDICMERNGEKEGALNICFTLMI